MNSKSITRPIAYVWAFPTTAVGLVAGGLTLLGGGKVQVRRGTLEFYGGFPKRLLSNGFGNFAAMTLGHVIIGRDLDCLDYCRDHEQVHVRQVEAWGPFFLPAYVACSVWEWARGRNLYRDNWFERDARCQCGEDL